MTTMKVVVFFDIFGAIGATVLIITFELIELESCACTQINTLEEGCVCFTPMMLGIRPKKGKTRQT